MLALVGETSRARGADLGCGTGRLTLALAAAGHQVTEVDPARASLDVARARPGAGAVRWLEGSSDRLEDAAYDVVVMTSHVAQFVVGDDAWSALLADLHRALVPGGSLFFDTRDPAARAWEEWGSEGVRPRVRLADGTDVEIWGEATLVADGLVDCTEHYRFADGEEVVGRARMRWRSEDLVRRTLADAGFAVRQVYGGWDREPVGAGDAEFLVLAERLPDVAPLLLSDRHQPDDR